MRKFLIVFAPLLPLAGLCPSVAKAQNPVVLDTWCAANGHTLHRDGMHDDSQRVSLGSVDG